VEGLAGRDEFRAAELPPGVDPSAVQREFGPDEEVMVARPPAWGEPGAGDEPLAGLPPEEGKGSPVQAEADPRGGPPPAYTVTTGADGRTVVDFGAGDDEVKVSQNADGSLRFEVNGETHDLTPAQSQRVTLRGGEGDDRITLDDSVTGDVRVEGGAGDDVLVGNAADNWIAGGEGDDLIVGGAGDDTLIGQAGDDTVTGGDGVDYLEGGAGDDLLDAGAGRDVVYGLGGDDTLLGGADQDYLDGGLGDDMVQGGAGNDAVIGGRGDDRLLGGEGDDVIAGGEGRDVTIGGAGDDQHYVQDEDIAITAQGADTVTTVDLSTRNALGGVPGSSIQIRGDAEFQARVESDLDALRSLPAGREMLLELDNSGHTTTIEPTTGGNMAFPANNDVWLQPDGSPGPGADATIRYNTSRVILGGGAEDWMTRPPVIGLFHEMVHAYNFTTGTLPPGYSGGTRNAERGAVGLPYDHDGDPSTPWTNPNPVTENDLRAQLGLPRRPHY
jgi:hypothetical protein